MNPVSERYLLIDRLDTVMIWSLICWSLAAIAVHYIDQKFKRPWYWLLVDRIFCIVMTLAVFYYLYWRVFLAWEGIYY